MNKANHTAQISWQEIGADDYTAISQCKKYFFRAEDMGDYWWWSAEYLSETIGGSAFSYEVARTKEDAFRLAEKSYREHKELITKK